MKPSYTYNATLNIDKLCIEPCWWIAYVDLTISMELSILYLKVSEIHKNVFLIYMKIVFILATLWILDLILT